MSRQPAPDVATMLRRNGIDGVERPLSGGGYTSASISLIESGGKRFVLKRLDPDDWLARLTHDASFREVQFALSALPAALPGGVAVASIDAAIDGAGRALLMRDVSDGLLPADGLVDAKTMDVILGAVARMHAHFHQGLLDHVDVGWCPTDRRLRCLSPATGQMLKDEGRDFGIARGWRLFASVAPKPAAELVATLFGDSSPLVDRLNTLPGTLLHGDLKVANMALDVSGALTLLDWAMVGRGPIAIDLVWLLAVNSSRLPWTLDETIERYAAHLGRESGRPLEDFSWDEQLHAVALCGLMLYGWGKALDAEAGRPDELRWWCARALAAAGSFGLT